LASADVSALADAFVASLTLGAGQFCTNPGLVFVPNGSRGDEFVAAAAQAVRESTGQLMLTPGIASAYSSGVETLAQAEGVQQLAAGQPGDGPGRPAPVLSAAARPAGAAVEEVFGASGVVIRWSGEEELLGHLRALEGQLTATLHYAPDDAELARSVLPILEDKVGRILVNGWPTGVEVSHAMVHGGPFPATSAPATTSVGSLAIERFQRPVCYQDVPPELLPPSLADENPWGLTRRIDGALRTPEGDRS
jgi:NADP-dependent aldehyde dehydrogenase